MSNSTKKWSSVSTSTQDLITEESPQNETPTCSSSGSKNATMLSRLKNFAEKDAFDSDFKINDDQEIEPEFGVLARLRKGIKIIHDHSRETMAECYSEESRQDMQERLEKSTLKMLKAEKSFMNTGRIIAEVVDEFSGDKKHKQTDTNNENDDDDDDEKVVFRSDLMTSPTLAGFRNKVNSTFGDRMTNYQNGLTDEILRDEKKFKDLQRQIRYGRKDAERHSVPLIDRMPGGEGDVISVQSDDDDENDDNIANFANSDERRNAASEEEDDYDEAILPTLDPINKEPIRVCVTNKTCHHVFDKASIYEFIASNPNAKCPVEGCKNEAVLKREDFIFQEKLTGLIRMKNDKTYGNSTLKQ